MLMKLFSLDILGYLAAMCTTFSFLPQAIKTIRTGDTSGLSLVMYLVFVTGVLLWAAYGFVIQDMAVIAANILTTVLSLCILVIIIRNHMRSGGGRKSAAR